MDARRDEIGGRRRFVERFLLDNSRRGRYRIGRKRFRYLQLQSADAGERGNFV
jgi:hypothetical protein